ncbi:MAG: thioredoxin domain-containing protein [Planctomycetota bacterium]
MSQSAPRLLLVGVLTASLPAAVAGEWRSDFHTAEREAADRGLPLVLHFYADWCGPCRAMKPALRAKSVTDLLDAVAIGVQINVDRNRSVASRFGVAGLPSDVVVGPDGKTLARYVGGSGSSTIASRISRAADRVLPRDRGEEGASAVAIAANDVPPAATPPSDVADAFPVIEFATDPGPGEDDTVAVLMRLAAANGVGLAGYCPVALTHDHVWKKGNESLEFTFEGATYRLADADAFETFREDPAAFAPVYCGFDPLLLATEHKAVPGRIEFGSFRNDRLHLHASEKTRREFVRSPSKYEIPAVIEVPESVAAGDAGVTNDRG